MKQTERFFRNGYLPMSGIMLGIFVSAGLGISIVAVWANTNMTVTGFLLRLFLTATFIHSAGVFIGAMHAISEVSIHGLGNYAVRIFGNQPRRVNPRLHVVSLVILIIFGGFAFASFSIIAPAMRNQIPHEEQLKQDEGDSVSVDK